MSCALWVSVDKRGRQKNFPTIEPKKSGKEVASQEKCNHASNSGRQKKDFN